MSFWVWIEIGIWAIGALIIYRYVYGYFLWNTVRPGRSPGWHHRQDAREKAFYSAVVWPFYLVALSLVALVCAFGWLVWKTSKQPAIGVVKSWKKSWERFPITSHTERDRKRAWNNQRDLRSVPPEER